MVQNAHLDESVGSLLGKVAGEYFEAVQRGENPQIEDFVRRFPDIAEHIRRAFPALALVLDPDLDEEAEGCIDPARPRQIGEFRILGELGRGGMGVVYEAEQLSMGRHVALKVLPFAAMAGRTALDRFNNEVRAAATLEHPHIVSIYSVGEDRGIHYYAMRLIRGQSLSIVIDELRRQRDRNQDLDVKSVSQAVYGGVGGSTTSGNRGPRRSPTSSAKP